MKVDKKIKVTEVRITEFRVTEITEAEVVRASTHLEQLGYEYDVDYTTLYGANGAPVGLEITSEGAAQSAINLLTRQAAITREET